MLFVKVVLYRLCVNAIWQHPPLVIVSAKAQLSLLVRVHSAFVHPKTAVCGHVLIPIQSPLVSLP